MRHCTVLLTGAAGRLGQALRPLLASRCEALRLADRQPLQADRANETTFLLDLNDPAGLREAMAGCSAVVHLAGYPREAGWDVLLPANIQGVINLWEAAHATGVDRIVHASSNHAVGFYPRQQMLDETVPPKPDSRYGVTKVFMEGLAELYACKHGLRGFGIRIGHCAAEPSDARMLSHWIHPEDLAALISVGLDADYECEIVYGASANSRTWWDNRRAHALGYRPQHSADAFEAALLSCTSGQPVAEYFQGGSFAAHDYTNDRSPRR
jgi:uronate dehydrogenase